MNLRELRALFTRHPKDKPASPPPGLKWHISETWLATKGGIGEPVFRIGLYPEDAEVDSMGIAHKPESNEVWHLSVPHGRFARRSQIYRASTQALDMHEAQVRREALAATMLGEWKGPPTPRDI